MGKKEKTRSITIEVTEANYKHLQEIAERYTARCKGEAAWDVGDVANACIRAGFYPVEVDSYGPEQVEPVGVNISGVVAMPPGSTRGGDMRACAGLIMDRFNRAFPCNSTQFNLSAVTGRSKHAKAWKEIIEESIHEDSRTG